MNPHEEHVNRHYSKEAITKFVRAMRDNGVSGEMYRALKIIDHLMREREKALNHELV